MGTEEELACVAEDEKAEPYVSSVEERWNLVRRLLSPEVDGPKFCFDAHQCLALLLDRSATCTPHPRPCTSVRHLHATPTPLHFCFTGSSPAHPLQPFFRPRLDMCVVSRRPSHSLALSERPCRSPRPSHSLAGPLTPSLSPRPLSVSQSGITVRLPTFSMAQVCSTSALPT